MEKEILNKELVSYCGLYCGACRKYIDEKCPGCHGNEKATWCKIRKCCIENNYLSCAECKEFENPLYCNKFNNLFSKLFEFFYRSNRKACIEMIKEKGYEEYVKKMAAENLVCLKKQ